MVGPRLFGLLDVSWLAFAKTRVQRFVRLKTNTVFEARSNFSFCSACREAYQPKAAGRVIVCLGSHLKTIANWLRMLFFSSPEAFAFNFKVLRSRNQTSSFEMEALALHLVGTAEEARFDRHSASTTWFISLRVKFIPLAGTKQSARASCPSKEIAPWILTFFVKDKCSCGGCLIHWLRWLTNGLEWNRHGGKHFQCSTALNHVYRFICTLIKQVGRDSLHFSVNGRCNQIIAE